jgi:hypothetical protein
VHTHTHIRTDTDTDKHVSHALVSDKMACSLTPCVNVPDLPRSKRPLMDQNLTWFTPGAVRGTVNITCVCVCVCV